MVGARQAILGHGLQRHLGGRTHECDRGRSESRLLVLGWACGAGNKYTGLGWEPNPRHVLRHQNLETPKWRRQGPFPS